MAVPFAEFINLTPIKRLKTSTINIGQLALGGNAPIRIQSMTSVDTLDTASVVAQCIRLIEAGSELVRITAPGVREAEHLAVIKNELLKSGYTTPLVADIHFSPAAAEVAARIVEKVRINPGNYTEHKTGKTDYTETEYQLSIDRIRQRIEPLIRICKDHGTALRIGSNHGSLSERILSRYGDTPEGMVQSAIEFIDICEDLDFHNLVLSMKASNSRIMVQASRLLVNRMLKRGTVYPLHLGVTEAGEGEDGRIRSAAGIGALLAEGIGDTIRVSLTEEPEYELPVARRLVGFFKTDDTTLKSELPEACSEKKSFADTNDIINPVSFNRNLSSEFMGIGNGKPVIVIGDNQADFQYIESIRTLVSSKTGNKLHLVSTLADHPQEPYAWLATAEQLTELLRNGVSINPPSLVILHCDHLNQLYPVRCAIANTRRQAFMSPIVIKHDAEMDDADGYSIETAALLGSLLIDGLADGVWLSGKTLPETKTTQIAYNLLQATRLRFTRTEYISCPSCGRTRFNIQELVKRVRNKTEHLTGLTIGVMGCIVNGPGEMSGADYGVVGAGNGIVTLFKGQHINKQGITEADAVNELIALIKAGGDWHEPA
ncbi:MAG: 4-hydroxy-3-methylbut-2-en-1-yl diphosphate synthase [Bacteroidetes bacterium HGW-Bacteroidetes-22]|nr:MAG: 4-hydroxy-3-methylbut-2-en-1-yl diphosphate synthase [Bacteroidetes bacterium HGW-Bacteroidetes-22]